jgi:deoxyribonuclease (pyrimidine dimer)
MTRINIINPHELTDQHLIAEYREITMVPGSLNRTLNSKSGYQESRVPTRYTLNSGHVYFFYNKGKYLHKRYKELINEMKRRGFNPDSNRLFPDKIFKDNNLYNDWIPSLEDYKIIRQRIKDRISKKPEWYRRTEYVI